MSWVCQLKAFLVTQKFTNCSKFNNEDKIVLAYLDNQFLWHLHREPQKNQGYKQDSWLQELKREKKVI